MRKLTEKQLEFVKNKAHGVRNKEAAVAAGFSVKSADAQAGQLMARADIKEAIKRYKKLMRAEGQRVPKDEDEADVYNSMPKSKYTDPIEFLEDMMNHKKAPLAMRADAAKQLLPYKHARIGEQGKKESAKDRAKKIAGSAKPDQRHRLQPQSPPKLHAVN